MVELPSTLKQPVDDLSAYSFLFAGEKKVGKTSFFAAWPSHFIMEFEVGNAQHLNANYEDISSWEQFLEYLKLLENNPNYCKTLILDAWDSLYDYCYYYVRKKLLKYDDTDKDDFDIWRTIKNLMREATERIRRLPCGKIYGVHTALSNSTDLKGNQVSKLETSMGGQQTDLMDKGFTHFWGVMLRDSGGHRYIRTQGDSFIKAGNSLAEKHFRWNGYPVKEIPMGSSPEEAYSNFINCFNNRLPVAENALLKSEKPQIIPVQSNGEPSKPKVVFVK